jgi:hypothetical protein
MLSTSAIERPENIIRTTMNVNAKNSIITKDDKASQGESIYTPVLAWKMKKINIADKTTNAIADLSFNII